LDVVEDGLAKDILQVNPLLRILLQHGLDHFLGLLRHLFKPRVGEVQLVSDYGLDDFFVVVAVEGREA